jgi:hypothetical protein
VSDEEHYYEYEVTIQATATGTITVMAENEEEARLQAQVDALSLEPRQMDKLEEVEILAVKQLPD